MADVARRLGAFIAVTAVATIAAFGAFVAVISLRIGGDQFFIASIANAALVLPVAFGCGVVVAVASTIRPAPIVDFRRAQASGALLCAIGVTSILVWSALPARSFDAGKFRAAAAAYDYDALEGQANRAVEQKVLIGMTASQARTTLGAPHRIGPKSHLWIWDLGMINDFLGPGDAGALYVQFDPSWGRVVSAKVDQTW